MYFKIKALAATGNKIILHYFDYNLSRNAKGLERFCEKIYSYKRKSIFKAFPINKPFIVESRINLQLINRINEDDYPVLLEGLHCSGIIPFLNNKERVVIRMHNEEASYYHHLGATEKSFVKKIYFKRESQLLKSYQQNLAKNIKLACLSETDIDSFRNFYRFETTSFIPCFIPWQTLSIVKGWGDYCLYHGNLLVSENEEAAIWLIQNVFKKIRIPFTIAGKGISKRLLDEASAFDHITLINNPSIDQISTLIQQAQVNVLPSMNNTGVKLKLLNALLNGRHCITNYNGVNGSKITGGLTVADSVSAWLSAIPELMETEFSEADMAQRKKVLELYDNRQNAEKLNALWRHYL